MGFRAPTSTAESPSATSPAIVGGASWRALVVGSVMCAIIGVATPYATHVMHASYMALDFSAPAAIFLFFVLVFLINGLLRSVATGAALTSGELLVVFIMMMVACAIPTMGLTAYLVSQMAAPFYYAAPENQWAEVLLPHIREWLYPQDPLAIKWLFEGLPAGEAIPWSAWVMPLLVWASFLLALYFVMICAMVILRKQWVEHERLLYPITQLPMAMVEGEARPGFTNPILRNAWLWAGFLPPFLIGCYIALSHYDTSFPPFEWFTSFDFFRGAGRIIFRISFPMIGFSYLLSTRLALSLWLFSLVTTVERAALRMVGYEGLETIGPYASSGGGPLLGPQSQAALYVLALFGLWIGRHHLKQVVAKAFGRRNGASDADEILPYRTAFWGMVVGLVYLVLWLHHSGLDLWVAALLVVVSMATFLGVTRIVAAGGVAETRAPVPAATSIMSAVGPEALGSSNLASLGMTYIWMGDIRTFVMAACANGLKLTSMLRGRKRPVFWAMALAIVVALVFSVWATLKIAYMHGGANANRWFFETGPCLPFHYAVGVMKTPVGASVNGWIFRGIGAASMSALLFMHLRFVWWPLHPLGFPIASVWLTGHLWFSIFLAWAVKVMVLRYGGAELYRRTRFFFLGLILGQYTVCGVWIVIDLFTGKVGNTLFWI
ncbi:hypothetical protein HQ576_14360 [bacterium]|nr:hypothetical protein [bacterium]